MALTVEAVRVGRVLLHMKVHSDFDYFYSGGAHKRPLVNILKGHKAKMGLMAGFDSGLIATSNRLGWPGDGETGDPTGQRDTGSLKCEKCTHIHTHTYAKTQKKHTWKFTAGVSGWRSHPNSWVELDNKHLITHGTCTHKVTYMSDKRICTMYRSPSANLI